MTMEYSKSKSEDITGILTTFPKFSYSTEWCDYSNSPAGSIINPLLNLMGKGTDGMTTLGVLLTEILGIEQGIAQVNGGATQVKAKAGDDAVLKLTFNMMAFAKDAACISSLSSMTSLEKWFDIAKSVMMCQKKFNVKDVFKRKDTSKDLTQSEMNAKSSEMESDLIGSLLKFLSAADVPSYPYLSSLKIYKSGITGTPMISTKVPWYMTSLSIAPDQRVLLGNNTSLNKNKTNPIIAEVEVELTSRYRLGQNEMKELGLFKKE